MHHKEVENFLLLFSNMGCLIFYVIKNDIFIISGELLKLAQKGRKRLL